MENTGVRRPRRLPLNIGNRTVLPSISFPHPSMPATAEREITLRPATLRLSEGAQKNGDVDRYRQTLDYPELHHLQATINQWFEKKGMS